MEEGLWQPFDPQEIIDPKEWTNTVTEITVNNYSRIETWILCNQMWIDQRTKIFRGDACKICNRPFFYPGGKTCRIHESVSL